MVVHWNQVGPGTTGGAGTQPSAGWPKLLPDRQCFRKFPPIIASILRSSLNLFGFLCVFGCVASRGNEDQQWMKFLRVRRSLVRYKTASDIEEKNFYDISIKIFRISMKIFEELWRQHSARSDLSSMSTSKINHACVIFSANLLPNWLCMLGWARSDISALHDIIRSETLLQGELC